MSFRSTNLATRLFSAVAIGALLLALIIAVSAAGMGRLRAHLDGIAERRLPALLAAKDMVIAVRSMSVVARNMVLLKEPAAVRKEIERLQRLRLDFAALERRLRTDALSEVELAALDKVTPFIGPMHTAMDKVAALGLLNNDEEGTRVLMTEVRTPQFKALDALDELVGVQRRLTDQAQAQARQDQENGLSLLLSLGAATLVVLVAGGGLLARHLVRLLGGEPDRAADIVGAIAGGDLTCRFVVRPGDGSSLLARMVGMQTSLIELVSKVRQNSESVATASAQIARGNLHLSQRTEEQAAALQQTSASMEQLKAAVEVNASHARLANEFAQGASAVAAQGGDVVAQVVDTMRAIDARSKKVSNWRPAPRLRHNSPESRTNPFKTRAFYADKQTARVR